MRWIDTFHQATTSCDTKDLTYEMQWCFDDQIVREDLQTERRFRLKIYNMVVLSERIAFFAQNILCDVETYRLRNLIFL